MSSSYVPPGSAVPFTVPDSPDTPDVPRDFRRFADSLWQRPTGVSAEVLGRDLVMQGSTVPVVGVSHSYAAGTLLVILGTVCISSLGEIICYYGISRNGAPASATNAVVADPNYVFSMHTMLTAGGGNERIDLMVTAASGNVQVQYRDINVQAMLRA